MWTRWTERVKDWLRVHSKLLKPSDILLWNTYVRSQLASVGVFHYKTESIVGLESILQCLDGEKEHIGRERNLFYHQVQKNSYNKSPAEDAHGQVWRINILSISEIKITDKINKWKPSEWPEHHLAIKKDFIKWVTCSHREERVACVLQHPALCNCVGHFILPTNKLLSGSENA